MIVLVHKELFRDYNPSQRRALSRESQGEAWGKLTPREFRLLRSECLSNLVFKRSGRLRIDLSAATVVARAIK